MQSDLECRIRLLERRVRQLAAIAGGSTALLVLAIAGGAVYQLAESAKEVRAKRFVLVNEEGTDIGTWDAEKLTAQRLSAERVTGNTAEFSRVDSEQVHGKHVILKFPPYLTEIGARGFKCYERRGSNHALLSIYCDKGVSLYGPNQEAYVRFPNASDSAAE